jgi:hypothetical protein
LRDTSRHLLNVIDTYNGAHATRIDASEPEIKIQEIFKANDYSIK